MTSLAAHGAPSEEVEARWKPVYVDLLREWLARGEAVWLPLIGHSMSPVLPAGTRVLLTAPGGWCAVPGEIVAYEEHGAIVCHRVLRVRAGDRLVLAKGDAWRTRASWIPATRLLAKVVAIERCGAWFDLDTPWRRRAGRLIAAGSRLVAPVVQALRTARGLVERSRPCAPAR